MIHNPILPGFHTDPSICRRENDYYIALSSFEWLPGIPIYHSRDLKHWELYTHILTELNGVSLKGIPSSKGVWAPCLTWCAADGLFYLVYGVMHSMNARYFDIDNYLITSPDIRGPWSKAVYLHSAGFDASMFHGEDGRKWVVSLEWETRDGYRKPGAISLAEYLPEKKQIADYPKRIWYGATNRGCLEGPHIFRRNGYYYLMCAEGGTGYYHCVSIARSRNLFGPYEADPDGPVLTSNPVERDERANIDHLKPQYYNPEAELQKAGHGCYVETTAGEAYISYHCSRPILPELRCTLGRETALARMEWTEADWLRLKGGGNLALAETEESTLPDAPVSALPGFDDFDESELRSGYYAPRDFPSSFVDLVSRPGWLRMRGQESGSSLNCVSLLARVLTSVHASVTTKLEFEPECYQHSAGLILYYDNMNYAYLRKYWSDTAGGPAISVIRVVNGQKVEFPETRTPVKAGPLWFCLKIDGRSSRFSYSLDGNAYNNIGPEFDTSEFSDEFCKFGEFTGTMVGITCADRMFHRKTADFDWFAYQVDENESVQRALYDL